MQKRVLAIHDISCVGKCSLTVALPILSAAGFEVSVLPTAVLSTHTGGFENYTFRDLTDDLLPIADHWESLGLKFDAIYTGYLGSYRQLEIVAEIIRRFKTDSTLVLIDPVMGDGGKLYPAFEGEFASGMAKLCKMADIIVPNLTEAAYLTGTEYLGSGYSEADIEKLMLKLSSLGAGEIILSGTSYTAGKVGAAAYTSRVRTFCYYENAAVPGHYHGTGDIFSSALLAALLTGAKVAAAIKTAADFTRGAILRTYEAGTDVRYGVDFESGLADFIRELNR